MQMCARCHKRVAVVFITRLENNQTINEGLCLQCARELGIKPVNDMLEKMGISEEDFDRMSEDMRNIFDNLPDAVSDTSEDGEDGGAPAIDIPKLFQGLKMQSMDNAKKAANGETGKKGKKNPDKKFLTTYCHNLTERARQGKLDNIVGRKRELDRVIQILCRRQKNNPCLIGEPGVGKTAIAEALAIKIVSGDVPYKLKNAEIYLVDLTALVAGTQFRGQFESRVLGLISEVKADGNIILVIDEVHNIVGAGESEGSMNAANILKPALSRGEIQVIGATTLKEYRKYIEKDSALERRFQPIIVNEPSISESIEMLLGIKKYYEDFHSVQIPDIIISDAVTLSERYITDRFLPDKAIDLLDEAASHLSLSTPEINEKKDVEKQLLALQNEKSEVEAIADSEDAAKNEEKYKRLADIKVSELNLLKRKEELEIICNGIFLSSSDLADVIEIWTGVPASAINLNEFEKLNSLKENIKKRIVGQDEAVDAVVSAIKRKRSGVSYRMAPTSFIFAGPTGVGKTELVKVLSENMFSRTDALIRLDMSEYMEKHSVSKIIGAPPGYIGYDEAGQLTEKIRRNPYSVILFDEIEKAHPDVLNILLQVLDEGKLTDAAGRKVSFENCIIIMTTNAGSDKGSSISGFAESSSQIAKNRTEKALSEFLRPEFINRIDEIITFNKLTMNGFVMIADIMMSQLCDAVRRKGIQLSYSKEVLSYISENSFSEKYGARNMRRFIEKNIEDKLANVIIENYSSSIKSIFIEIKDNQISITTD